MAESSFLNFFNNSRSFGMNVKVPERTIKQAGETAGKLASGVLEPLFSYLQENENVFSGDLTHELNKRRVENFNMNTILTEADIAANGERPTFDAKF